MNEKTSVCSWEDHVHSLVGFDGDRKVVDEKLETDDGDGFGNLHASRKLKVIFLVTLKQV